VTPVGGSYYAHIGPGLADRVDTLLPARPDAERRVIIKAAEDTAVAATVAERFGATGIATYRVAMPDTQLWACCIATLLKLPSIWMVRRWQLDGQG
jgi:shikimate kinase/3-dehydroquinate synthase